MRWVQLTCWQGAKTAPVYIDATQIALLAGPSQQLIKGAGGHDVTELAMKGTSHAEALLIVEPPEVVLARMGAVLDDEGHAAPWEVYWVRFDPATGRPQAVELRSGTQRVELHAVEGPREVEEEP